MIPTRQIERNETNTEQFRATLAEKGLNTYRLKVSRQEVEGGLVSDLAHFDEAIPRHLLSPATWLTRFAGGGRYHLLPCTPDDNEERLCASPLFVILPGEPISPVIQSIKDNQNGDNVSLEGWDGPPVLKFVEAPPAPKGNNAIPTGPQQPQQAIIAAPAAPLSPKAGREWEEITNARVNLEREKSQLAIERAQAAAENDKAKLQSQLDDEKRRAAQDREAAERKLKLLEEENKSAMNRLSSELTAQMNALQARMSQAPAQDNKLDLLVRIIETNATAAVARAEADAKATAARADEALKQARQDAKEAREFAAVQAEKDRQHAKELAEAQNKPSPQSKMFEEMIGTVTKVAQSVVNLAQMRSDLAPQGAEAPRSGAAEMIDALGGAAEKIGTSFARFAQLRSMAAGATGLPPRAPQPQRLPPAQAAPQQPGQPAAAPAAAAQPKPAPKPAPAPVGHPDRYVQRLLNQISAFTPPDRLVAMLDEMFDQSAAEPGATFHTRTLFNEEFLNEVAPYMQPWFDREGERAQKYLVELDAYVAEVSKQRNEAEAAPQNAPAATGANPLPAQTPPAAQREPAQVD